MKFICRKHNQFYLASQTQLIQAQSILSKTQPISHGTQTQLSQKNFENKKAYQLAKSQPIKKPNQFFQKPNQFHMALKPNSVRKKLKTKKSLPISKKPTN